MKKILYIFLTCLIISCSEDKNGGSSGGDNGGGGEIPVAPAEPGVYDIENLNSKPVVMGDSESANIPMDLTDIEKPIGNVPTIPIHTGIEFGVYLQRTIESTPEIISRTDQTNFRLLGLLQSSKEKNIVLNLYSPVTSDINIDLFNSLGEKVKSFHKKFELGNNELTLDFTGFVDGVYAVDFVDQSFRINFPLTGNIP